jgi:hypothetical protein
MSINSPRLRGICSGQGILGSFRLLRTALPNRSPTVLDGPNAPGTASGTVLDDLLT